MSDPIDLDFNEWHSMGTEDPVAAQHARGKLTARERFEVLLDADSFEEMTACERATGEAGGGGPSAAEAVVAGWGEVNGRPIFVYAEDFTKSGGVLTPTQAQKIVRLQDMARHRPAPIVGLFDSMGIHLAAGIGGLAAHTEIYRSAAELSRLVPQISLIMGPCIGAQAFAAALSDFIFMIREQSTLFGTGPEIVEAARRESVSAEELGGARKHALESGVADGAYDNDVTALLQMRRLLDLLPSARDAEIPEWPSFDEPQRIEMSLDNLVPDDPVQAYDVKELLLKTVDEGDFFEIQEEHARNIAVGFGRIDGRSVGLVANQPQVLAGVLDRRALRKAARFVRFCDRFNIPIVTFADVPGFLPGLEEEQGGIVRDGAALIAAYALADVPKVTVALRNGFGPAVAAMGAKALGADVSYAWPTARIGLIGPHGAFATFDCGGRIDAALAAANEVCEDLVLSLDVAFNSGVIDVVIAPHETRPRIAHALALLRHKRARNRSGPSTDPSRS